MTDRLDRRTVLRGGAAVPLALLAACSSDDSGSSSGSTPSSSSPSSPSTPSSSGPSSSAPSTSASSASPSADGLALAPGREQQVADGIEVPWGIVFLPGGGALVSSRDTGAMLRVGGGRARQVGTVPGVLSNKSQGGEAGLLGLALHPRFASEPWVYAYHTTSSDNRVVRMRYDGGRLGRPRTVLDGIEMSLHHNGGGLAFGPDGHLFVSTGDAENKPNAQDRGSLNGKVLRITDTGRAASGNPFRNPVWTYGHRNVEGLAFDADGRLWASEFGDKGKDELNRIDRGDDYGWPDVEGGDGPGGFHDPLATWPVDDCSPSGIAILHGRAWLGALQGECVYSVVLSGRDQGRVQRHASGTYGRIRAVAAAPDGSLWVGTSNKDGRADPGPDDDRLLRVTLT